MSEWETILDPPRSWDLQESHRVWVTFGPVRLCGRVDVDTNGAINAYTTVESINARNTEAVVSRPGDIDRTVSGPRERAVWRWNNIRSVAYAKELVTRFFRILSRESGILGRVGP